jgi:hypothetical protein
LACSRSSRASRSAGSATAGAPEILVDQLLERLADLGYQDVEIETTSVEDVVFSMPLQLAGGSRANQRRGPGSPATAAVGGAAR